MRTPEEWVEWLLAEHGTGTPADVVWLPSGDALGVVRRIQAETANSSLPDVPPGVLMDEAEAELLRRDFLSEAFVRSRFTLEESADGCRIWHRREGSPQGLTGVPVAEVIRARYGSAPDAWEGVVHFFRLLYTALVNLPALLRDREALLRLLHDSEGFDAYQRGWAAGLDAGQRQALQDARERLSRAELSENRRQLVAATLRLFDAMLEELDRA